MLTSFIVDWANGTNSGLVLIPNFSLGGVTMYSSEANTAVLANSQFHPELIISFTAVPEPSTLALLGIGAVGIIGCGWRRRKKK